MEILFVTILLTFFVKALMEKFSVWYILENYGRKSRYKFIYKLTTCQFCVLFHLGWVLWFLVMFFESLGIMYVLMPFCVSGALKINNK